MLEKLAKQTAVYGISTIVVRFLSYLLTPYYTRIFGQETYGIVTDIYALIPLALTLLTMGMESSYFRFSAKAEEAGGDVRAAKRRLFATTWGVTSLAAVVFFVLAAVRIPEPFAIQDAKSEKKDKHSAMSFRHFVLGTVAIFIYVGVEVGIPNFMNLFLTSTPDAATPGIGMAAAAAGSLVGTYWFLMMCGRLIGGVIGGKVSSKAQLTAVSVVALVFVLLGIFAPIDTMGRMPVFTGTGFAMIEVPIGVMFLTLCGLCTSVMWGGIFNLAVEGLGKYTSMGSGIFMVMVCGGGILPLIQGYVADISNYLSSYWVIIAGLAYMLFYALVGSKNVNKDIPVED